MTAADDQAEIARLEAALVRAEAARDDAVSALDTLGLIVRASCAAMIAAADTLAPQTTVSSGGVERLFHDLAASAQAASESPTAPVLPFPARTDTRTAAAVAPATAGTAQIPREEPK